MYCLKNECEEINMNTNKSKFINLFLALLITGCTSTKVINPQESVRERRIVEPIVSLGGPFKPSAGVSSMQSRVVLYRVAQSPLPGATSVFLDGRYHASLEAGAWTELCYKTGPTELGARQMRVGSSPKDLPDTITAISLTPGQTHYLRVQQSGSKPVLQPVAAAQALQELVGTREQLHTVSRVAQACNEVTAAATPAPTPAVPVPAQTYLLPADTLFAFDRSDRDAMTDNGTRAIDSLLARLAQDFSRIDRLHLIGHADPLGSPERNERLAIERAQTVREYIATTGQLQAPITTEGRSSREPVVRHCGSVASARAIACNQPNRRVAIEVTGVRR
jgi:outer membrane protein OmpA-like peptidoglycan-associated protein